MYNKYIIYCHLVYNSNRTANTLYILCNEDRINHAEIALRSVMNYTWCNGVTCTVYYVIDVLVYCVLQFNRMYDILC